MITNWSNHYEAACHIAERDGIVVGVFEASYRGKTIRIISRMPFDPHQKRPDLFRCESIAAPTPMDARYAH